MQKVHSSFLFFPFVLRLFPFSTCAHSALVLLVFFFLLLATSPSLFPWSLCTVLADLFAHRGIFCQHCFTHSPPASFVIH